eukprot:gene19765-21700_t
MIYFIKLHYTVLYYTKPGDCSLFAGGIESSATSSELLDSQSPAGEVELSSVTSSNTSLEESSTESSFSPATSTPVTSDRREKIAQFLKDEREKKMSPRVSIQAQQLKCMKEDLELKRKCSQKDEETEKEKEMLSEAKKCAPLWKACPMH